MIPYLPCGQRSGRPVHHNTDSILSIQNPKSKADYPYIFIEGDVYNSLACCKEMRDQMSVVCHADCLS